MAFAVISDIHANLAALRAVFEDIDTFSEKRSRIDDIYCLGDIIGYGCQPVEVIKLLSERLNFKNIVHGNHEDFYWEKLKRDVDPKALLMNAYNQHLIQQDDFAKTTLEKLNGIAHNSRKIRKGNTNIILSHNGPDANYTSYRFPWDVEVLLPRLLDEFDRASKKDESLLSKIFKTKRNFYFFGHTHFPTLFYRREADGLGVSVQINPEDPIDLATLGSSTLLINPGAVGYSRDGNRNASYVIIDDERLYFRRVGYRFNPDGYQNAKIWLNENYPDREELGDGYIEDQVEKVHATARNGVFGANRAALNQAWQEYYF